MRKHLAIEFMLQISLVVWLHHREAQADHLVMQSEN